MSNATVECIIEAEAARYLEDLAYRALLGFREPVRSAEILASIGKSDYSAKLIRHVLMDSPRFAQIDRRWDLESRYEDKQRPMERVLRGVMEWAGFPMELGQLAQEISSVYDRPAEYYETVLARLLADSDKYFRTPDGAYGLVSWLLEITSEDPEDVRLDNELEESEIAAVEKAAGKAEWSADVLVRTAGAVVSKLGHGVSNKILQFLAWKAQGEAFDPVALFNAMQSEGSLVWLSTGVWTSSKLIEDYDVLLLELADKCAEETLEEVPAPKAEKTEAAEDAAPTLTLNISDRDLEEVAQIVASKGEARMPMILETIFEISPRDPVYAVAAEGLAESMRNDDRFLWAGTDRWRAAGTIPEHVTQIPAGLEIEQLSFETPEGEQLEVELEDDGLESGLDKEIHDPLVQDINDCDPESDHEAASGSAIRMVVARHHKKLGIYPLCRLPKDFLPSGPRIVEVSFVSMGEEINIWANRDTGLIYDMGQFYTDEMPQSGAVFELKKTDKPDVFDLNYIPTPDPLVHVPDNRIEELEELAAKSKSRPTFELIYDVLQQHRKGVAFVTLFTEVNIARRSTRRLVASILSSYYAFYQRPKSALWQFDEKKVDQGFKKAKKKYVRKG